MASRENQLVDKDDLLQMKRAVAGIKMAGYSSILSGITPILFMIYVLIASSQSSQGINEITGYITIATFLVSGYLISNGIKLVSLPRSSEEVSEILIFSSIASLLLCVFLLPIISLVFLILALTRLNDYESFLYDVLNVRAQNYKLIKNIDRHGEGLIRAIIVILSVINSLLFIAVLIIGLATFFSVDKPSKSSDSYRYYNNSSRYYD